MYHNERFLAMIVTSQQQSEIEGPHPDLLPQAGVENLPDLVPARMLNEFAYCPRLAYLEWVQGEFADNLEVLEGRFGHRRVDQPSKREVPAPDQQTTKDSKDGEEEQGDAGLPPDVEPIHSRSVMLSAPVEGLIAKIDLLEIQAGMAMPIDYKRGRVPDVAGNAWEPEQVQLCAQGLILRENGYLVEGGILYFIESRRRVSVPFDDLLVARTRDLLRQMRQMAAEAALPPPLDDSPKCPRCSLVGICLPDETRLLAGPEPRTEGEVRRLLPARDDALPLYVREQGATVGKSGDVLTVKQRQETLAKVRLIDVSQVALFGNVQLTAQALKEIAAAGIPICHFSYGGWFHAMTTGMTHKNVELRIRQFAAAAEATLAMNFARKFVVGKIKNCRTLLRRHLPDEPQTALALRQLNELGEKADAATDMASLLGIEGMAAKIYFAGFAKLLAGGETFDIEGRNRRPPRDPTNALLSFVYALLTKDLTLAVHAVGFDPMLGFYHQPRYGRPSLALDLAEEFRPLIADSVVLTLINNGEVSPGSFLRRAGAVALTDAGRRAVIAAFERRMDTLVTHPIFGYRISYRRVLEVQARLLARTLLGEIAEYPSFCTR
jgi:CRISPR-associated protein Cas1